MIFDVYSLQKIRYSCDIARQLIDADFGKGGQENLNSLAVSMCIVRLWETCRNLNDSPVHDDVVTLRECFPEVPWGMLKQCSTIVIHPTDKYSPLDAIDIFYTQIFPSLYRWCEDKQRHLGNYNY